MPSGTKRPAVTDGLTSASICSILNACAKANVASLTFGDLHVAFYNEASQLGRNQLASVDQPWGGETPLGSGTEQPLVMTAEDQELREDMRLAQLMTDNPVAYEQEMIDATSNEQVLNGGREDP